MLRITDLTVRYGNATALDGVDLHVEDGEMVALIGPNGAGKTTLVNTISGLLKPVRGQISVQGRFAHVPEGRQLFADMTVDDNLRLGAWRSAERNPQRVYRLLPDLSPLRNRLAGSLSGGQQQMVAVGRALMGDPKLLAVDELSLGLAPQVIDTLTQHLKQLAEQRGIAVLLIEQNARLAFELCRRAYVLEAGKIATKGMCNVLADDPRVQEAYLGRGLEETA